MAHTHVVVQGDCFSKIAMQYGFTDYKTLYDHPDNAELKQKRPNPNVLRPGDRIKIPEREFKKIEVATGKRHRFKLKLSKKALRLVLQAHDRTPLSGVAYKLDIGGPEPREGFTDDDGKLEEMIPADVTSAILSIDDRVLMLNLGHLNPLAEVRDGDFAGVQGRLKNLGYDPGPADGKYGPRTRAAIALFQADEDLDITGEADDTTLATLESVYGI